VVASGPLRETAADGAAAEQEQQGIGALVMGRGHEQAPLWRAGGTPPPRTWQRVGRSGRTSHRLAAGGRWGRATRCIAVCSWRSNSPPNCSRKLLRWHRCSALARRLRSFAWAAAGKASMRFLGFDHSQQAGVRAPDRRIPQKAATSTLPRAAWVAAALGWDELLAQI